jgi:ribonuclease R
MLLLRAMKQAAYDVANMGHFGLASKAYLHFTSPIRRYPDLVVHRAIREELRGAKVDRSEKAIEALREAAVTASDTERKAMEVEREVVDLYRALFMRSKIGAILEGTVTGFVGTGVFVGIDDPFVDVLVRMDELGPDQYALDDEGLRVIGMRSGDRISLGDPMLIEVEDVAILRRTVYGRRIVDPEERRFARGRLDAEAGTKRPARKVAARGRTASDARPARGAKGARAALEERPGKRGVKSAKAAKGAAKGAKKGAKGAKPLKKRRTIK